VKIGKDKRKKNQTGGVVKLVAASLVAEITEVAPHLEMRERNNK
jgi:hypothetical protein